MVHETAHQWIGDSVSVSMFADIWLSEGHATFYELLFADAEGLMPQARGAASLEAYMHLIYDASDALREAFGPVASPLNGDWTQPPNNNVYEGGALVLYALREHIGDAAFARLERHFARASPASPSPHRTSSRSLHKSQETIRNRSYAHGSMAPQLRPCPDTQTGGRPSEANRGPGARAAVKGLMAGAREMAGSRKSNGKRRARWPPSAAAP